MKDAFLFLLQLAILCAIYTISNYIVIWTDVPIPASVLGMIVLYGCLVKGIVSLNYIERAAVFLINHLGFFFIPFAVGLMNYGGLIRASGWQLLMMIVGSTLIGLVVTSGITQYLSAKEQSKHERSDSV
ncbi:CidA/LrgA family protein [Aquibacillus rhizosphaerae]|uniref:CidA/LrgA family protein n=1 Tax=Aquibacillus rhizosphaerae TaxID=3051431 RepID=A0ABT7L9V2_9BACI|nr:CidA/LrgA family protein [Aquibacillus sp. LR5S19]MDL4842651.1 CidA/LrgA family protein [Aquibacillus sp. LR5S19]